MASAFPLITNLYEDGTVDRTPTGYAVGSSPTWAETVAALNKHHLGLRRVARLRIRWKA